MATLWPDMPHFKYFAKSRKLDGIRLNTAMVETKGLVPLLSNAVESSFVPLYFDVKGRQLRITKVYPCDGDHLELDLNHEIQVSAPAYVLFKGGVDGALLLKAEGNHLIFKGGPRYNLLPGESLTIRAKDLKVLGATFTEQQLELLAAAKAAGIQRYMLSYASSDQEILELLELINFSGEEIIAKIENVNGLSWALESAGRLQLKLEKKLDRKLPAMHFLTARGDLFIELPKPHDILWATQQLISVNPECILGSRILLSLSENEFPSCSDLNEIAWLLSLGYRRFMFCDSLCLDRDALERAINILRIVGDNSNYGASNELL